MTSTLERPPAARRLLRGTRSRRTDPAERTPTTPGRPATSRQPVPGSQDGALAVMSTTATMCFLVAGWMLAQLLFLGGLAQARSQETLYDEFRAELAAGTAPLGPVTPVGTPVALISIPHLGVDQVVVEGTASGDLVAGPGHLRSTVLPGQAGTSAVFGRGATYGAPFARLGELTEGDLVTVVTAQGETRFRVLGVRRAGDPLPQPRPDGAARLVLVSSEGSGRLPSLSPSSVVYVDAEAKKALPTPPGVPGAVPDPEQAMGTEPAAIPLLTLCLGVLLALILGVTAARQRFPSALVWVVTTPVVLAAAWVTTDVVVRLLPNLM